MIEACPKCKKNQLQEGEKLCPSCRNYAKERMRAMRQRRKTDGKCIICGRNPATKGVTYCSSCAVDCTQAVIGRRKSLEISRLCILCGRNQPEDGLKVCGECSEKAHTKYNKKTTEALKVSQEA
ncbi:MAG: hypothetical protein HQK96_01565 [Nitrospirae bacterium]|nr:hypothetical protein [Nitrospirota bacterium]